MNSEDHSSVPTGSAETYPEPPALHCYRHPHRETLLRCNQCERPICTNCAVLTPIGYRCKECIAGHRKMFETARPFDYVIAMLVAALFAFAGSFAAQMMGFFTIFIAPVMGMLIVEAIRWLTGRRRSRMLIRVSVAAAVTGSLPLMAVMLLTSVQWVFSGNGFSLGNIWGLVIQLVYSFLVGSSVYARMSGISMR